MVLHDFCSVVTMTEKGRQSIDYPAAIVRQHLLQDACDSGHAAAVFDHMAVNQKCSSQANGQKNAFWMP